MPEHNDWEEGQETGSSTENPAALVLALALAAVTAVGTGMLLQHLLERRLTTPEKARLRFYRYLREKGRLES